MPPPSSPSRIRRIVTLLAWAAFLAAPLALAWALHAGAITIPERYNPWTPLDVAAEPGPLTSFKLGRARAEPALCMAALAASGLQYDPVADRETGTGCGFKDAVRLQGGRSLALSSPTVLSCRAALSFAMWERHALQPAATQRLGVPVARLEHLGSYACRDVNTGERAAQGSGRRSRHATADALDIAAFVREDRRRIVVRRDWTGDGAEALFLRDAHAGACRFFDGVLGPDYNAVHADHFHLEAGGWRMCR
ncbi:extensin family protein [Variovorax sp. KK3]|uniref:extensin-like domain-containing protein n=1 Tax=Variovorax sp. KK3 TaxID=1855728 RepID=UPI001C4DF095|nr:extensin family protein [Variovorax sp. KK3]